MAHTEPLHIADSKSNVNVVNGALVTATNQTQLDAFGRLRVSEVETLFDSKQLHDKQPLFWDEVTSGGSETSVHSTTDASTTMTATANGEYVIRQSKMRFNYQPGKSQLSFFTFVLGTGADITSRLGLFTGNTTAPYAPTTGIYLECDDGVVNLVVMKNGSATTVTQTDWNIDKLNGGGRSGKTLDWTKAQIMMMDYEWLGVGDIRVFFVVDHEIILAHKFRNANIVTSVYMESPNLPVRYEVRSTGGNGSLTQICCSVNSEAGTHVLGQIRSKDMGITANSIGTTEEVLIGMRLKTTHLDSSIGVRALSLINTSNGDVKYTLQFNPTLGGTALSWGDETNSGVQTTVTQGATVTTPGVVVYSGYVSNNISTINLGVENAIRLGSQIDATRDILVLTCQRLSSGSDTVLASLTWRELQ